MKVVVPGFDVGPRPRIVNYSLSLDKINDIS
jgi:hypothetical protein